MKEYLVARQKMVDEALENVSAKGNLPSSPTNRLAAFVMNFASVLVGVSRASSVYL
jgi:hypothetical protein